MRNLRKTQIVWRLAAASFLAAPFSWSLHAVADAPAVANVVLDSQQSAANLGKSIIAQYKPERHLEAFLPAQWWILNAAEKSGLHTLFRSWQHSGHLSDSEAQGWIELSVSGQHSARDTFWKRLKGRVRDRLQVPYLMSFLPNRLRKAFSEYQKYLDDPRQAVTEMEVTRIDTADHSELSAALVWLQTAGFRVKVTQRTPQQIEAKVLELADHTDKEMVRMVSGLDRVIPREQRLSLRTRVLDQIRYQLGIVRGMSFIHFELANNRTPGEKLVEAGVAGFVASVASICVFKTVHAMEVAGQAVNTWLPVVVTVADKLFFNYLGRAASSFFGQGWSFDFDRNKFEKNKLLFVLTTFLNSLFLRELMMVTTHTSVDLASWAIHFGVTWTMIAGAAGSSVRGLFSKFSLQLGIEKLREQLKNRPWLTVGILAAWNAVWAVVQVGDLYNWGIEVPMPGMGMIRVDARTVLGTLAVAGLAHEQIRDRKGWARRGRIVLEKLGLRKREVCESLLTIHLAPAPQSP